ncbi:MAG: threonine-phosphate decarboxylase [Nitrospirae bacterium]|nr:threonine-phosphate decarboxylase [Nitrospirota bacterium]
MIEGKTITPSPKLRTLPVGRQALSSYEHGGDIYRFAAGLGVSENKIVDFSASINPLGISQRVRLEICNHIGSLHNYPDSDAERLSTILGKYHGVNPKSIICGNGSTELIYLITKALKPKNVLIPTPTFSEYERACRMANFKFQISNFKLTENNNFDINPDEFISAMKGCDTAFLCNPNNPTGRLLGKDSVLKIAKAAKKLKCYLIVDEAFIDFCPEESVVRSVEDNPCFIVLRSMTKFYALSGLRAGFGVFPLNLIDRLKKFKEPWTVNTLAQKASLTALDDYDYANRTFKLIKKEKQFLEENFKKSGVRFIPSDANFYLLKIENAGKAIACLRKKGILVRDCSTFRGLDGSYIRIAVKLRKHNKILLNEIMKFYTTNNGRHFRESGNPEKKNWIPHSRNIGTE